MTNREAQVADAAEYDAEMEAVADILNDAFGNDPEELRAGMRERFGEQLDARNPRIGPARGQCHEFPQHTKVCVHCGCRKDWLILIGSKVCSAHTTHAKSVQWTRRGGNRPSPMEGYYGGSDRPEHDSGSRLARASDE